MGHGDLRPANLGWTVRLVLRNAAPVSSAMGVLATSARCGCYFGSQVEQDPDERVRRCAGSQLDGWIALGRRALEVWAPA